MKGLLAIEWLKVKKYRTFWVLVVLFLVLVPLWNYEIANGFMKFGGKDGINFLSSAYSFPEVWGNIAYWGSVFVLFVAILVIIITTNEYVYRTHRQNVIDGWTRLQFFNAKILVILALSAVSTLYMFVLGVLFGGITGGTLSGLFSNIHVLGYFFLLSVNYCGFAFLVSILVKRSGLSIGLFLLYALIIENIIKGLANSYTNLPYANFLPLQASDELLPFPLMLMAKQMMGAASSFSMTTYASVAMLWCAVYYFLCRYVLVKTDW